MPWPSAVHTSNDGIRRNVVTFYIDLDNIAMNKKKTRGNKKNYLPKQLGKGIHYIDSRQS